SSNWWETRSCAGVTRTTEKASLPTGSGGLAVTTTVSGAWSAMAAVAARADSSTSDPIRMAGPVVTKASGDWRNVPEPTLQAHRDRCEGGSRNILYGYHAGT